MHWHVLKFQYSTVWRFLFNCLLGHSDIQECKLIPRLTGQRTSLSKVLHLCINRVS